ncbi:hypothetical protein PRIPAC_88351 [Pristionchus pacificus]|uniref:G protein-coupled receptor n=1 Tax=Pristionchus pacificus TaxID=54126 RepID=A0A2A6CXP0_PRIPA|nr:hypothetical protein PRIPAC_88351 [Pristionchus pacificus]|eukprot:PDM82870.1 G protein-coupled receptor [Pristionchus pacificus]
MSTETTILDALVAITYTVMFITLPLHMRLLYVLKRQSNLVKLDGSFHTLMMHSTTGNLIFSIVFCFIQAPAGVGILFEFYVALGPVISHIELIKIWAKISYLCFALWFITLLISIPLMFPGRTAHYTMLSVFNTCAVQFTFDGFANQLYTVIGSFFALVIEIIAILLYIAMFAKFNEFKLRGKKKASEVKRMTQSVWRTTVAAMVASTGSWLIVFFFLASFIYSHVTGRALLSDQQYPPIFVALNNVLTPWGLLAGFPNLRARVFFKK